MKTNNKNNKPMVNKLNPEQLARLSKSVRLAALTITGHLPRRDDIKPEILKLLQVTLYKMEINGDKVWGYTPPEWVRDPEAKKIVWHTANRLKQMGIQSHQVEV